MIHRLALLAATALSLSACDEASDGAPASEAPAADAGDAGATTDDAGGDIDDAVADDAAEDDAAEDDATADATGDALPPLPESWSASVEDFGCLTEMTAVRGFFLANPLGRIDDAVAAAESDFATPVPPGTILQLIPQEAMVKGLPGSSPETDDWEFFLLSVDGNGTTVQQRGFAEVSNAAGSCWGCHVGASDRDGVCEQTGLCNAAALPRDVIDALVGADARCP